MLTVYTILQAGEHGWGSARSLGLGAVAVALISAFLARQARIANPLMPLRIFRSRAVSGANGVQALVVAGMFGMFFLGALYLQQILGYDALEVGLAFLPSTIAMGLMSLRFSGPLTTRFGPRVTLLPSLISIGAGLLLFARTPVHADYVVDVLPATVLIGLGAGLGFPSLMMLAMSSATPSDSGLASGLVNTSVQVGGAIGLAVARVARQRAHAYLDRARRPRRLRRSTVATTSPTSSEPPWCWSPSGSPWRCCAPTARPSKRFGRLSCRRASPGRGGAPAAACSRPGRRNPRPCRGASRRAAEPSTITVFQWRLFR